MLSCGAELLMLKIGFLVGDSRRDRWKEPKKSPAFLTHGDDDEIKTILERRRQEQGQTQEDELTLSSFIEPAKEIIFDKNDEGPVFHLVLPIFNTETGELEISAALSLSFGNLSPRDLAEEVKLVLALAVINDVPIYPNTEELAPELAEYHAEMLAVGFRMRDESGEYVYLQFNRSSGVEVDTLDHIEKIKSTELLSPAEVQMVKNTVLAEIYKRDEAGRVLTSLRLAIRELEELLEAKERNENALQRCLTQNPILFGTDYARVIPKHKLGDEYEMDYALERVSGLIDLVEIEASTHKLFTQAGDPRKELVHAEQQVLDWLDWIDHHGEYARDRLPGLMQPLGYVIIGRSVSLSREDRERLNRRNITFRTAFQVLTYDDLLDRAKKLLGILEGKTSST